MLLPGGAGPPATLPPGAGGPPPDAIWWHMGFNGNYENDTAAGASFEKYPLALALYTQMAYISAVVSSIYCFTIMADFGPWPRGILSSMV